MKIPGGLGRHDFDTFGGRHMANDTFTAHSLQGERGLSRNQVLDNCAVHETSAAQGLQSTYGAGQIDKMTAHEAEREFRWFKNKY